MNRTQIMFFIESLNPGVCVRMQWTGYHRLYFFWRKEVFDNFADFFRERQFERRSPEARTAQ